MKQWFKRFFNAQRVAPDSSGDGSSHSEPKIVQDFVRIAAKVKNDKRDTSIEKDYEAGEQHILDRQYDKAVECLERVIAQDRKNTKALARLGRAYLEFEEFDKALDNLNKALELKPDNIYALGHRGIVHREMKQYDKACADFTQVLALGYSRPWIVKELKDLYKKRQKPEVVDKPIDDESRQKAIQPGIEYIREGRYQEAVEEFQASD